MHLSLRVPKLSLRTRYDWRAFSGNSELQARYTAEIRNCIQLLDVEEEPRVRYMKFVKANVEAMTRCVPVMEKSRSPLRSKYPDVVMAC